MIAASGSKALERDRNVPTPLYRDYGGNDDAGNEHIRNPRGGGLGPRVSFRVRAKNDKEDASVQQLRATLTNSLVNMGLLSAFLCALSNAIYVSPPADPKCHGDSAIIAVHIIEWCSMGGFFLVIVMVRLCRSKLNPRLTHMA